MAVCLSNMPLPFSNPLSLPSKQLHFSVLSHKFQPGNYFHCQYTTRRMGPARVISKTNENSLSSIITELEKEESGAIDKTEHENELVNRWRELLGEDDWAGLLDPIDPLLRSELIRYGSKAQACYDAFDFDPSSKYCGSCRFTRSEFFQRLGMAEAGYDITRYLYATSNINLPNFFKKSRWPKIWSKNANWIGYIAVSNDEVTKKLGRRDVCISWRGTVTRLEWVADLTDYLRPISSDKIPCPDPTVKVESGFLDLYTDRDESCNYCKFSAREQILSEVNKLINETYANEEVSVTVTGHSLGGALALISAYDIVETGINIRNDAKAVPVCAFTFAGPRVGNARFKERLNLLGIKVLRVVNVHDIVPKSPGFLLNEKVNPMIMKICENLPWSYSHVGVELALDHNHSPFLRPDGDLASAHNLEAYLHLLNGYHGKGERFVPTSERDPALVNKGSDFLKDEYQIPPHWRQINNKGLVNKDGRWMQEERDIIDDDHAAETYRQLKKIGLS